MITKGIVERVISPYLCKVRIPIYDKAKESPNATPIDDLSEATFCSIPNVNVGIQAGDIVYVAFENNDIHNLVILGYLHKEGDTSTLLDIKGNTIEIETSANLPINTTIGNITAEEISYLAGLDGNIQAQIDLLKSSTPSGSGTTIPFVSGTQTEATGTWLGSINEISSLTDGQSIRYWLPYAGVSGINVTLNLTLNGTPTGAIDVYYNGTTRMTTQMTAGSCFLLTYRENVSIAGSGSYTGWWAKVDYQDVNPYYYTRLYGSPIAASIIYAYKWCMLDAYGRMTPIVITSGTGTSKAVTTVPVDPRRLFFNGSSSNIAANAYSTYYYYPYGSSNVRWTYNLNSTPATRSNIYFVGTFNSDGYFVFDNSSTTSWYKVVPMTATSGLSSYFSTGKIYLHAAISYSNATAGSLFATPLSYQFNGTNLVPYYPSSSI